MGSDPQSYLTAMAEMAHRECKARIKALEEAVGESQAAVDGAMERAEKAEGQVKALEKESHTIALVCSEAETRANRLACELMDVRERAERAEGALKVAVEEYEAKIVQLKKDSNERAQAIRDAVQPLGISTWAPLDAVRFIAEELIKQQGALKVAAAHNLELQNEHESQMKACALGIKVAHLEIDRLVSVRDQLQEENDRIKVIRDALSAQVDDLLKSVVVHAEVERENDRLKARIAELEEALRPFALYAQHLIGPNNLPDNCPLRPHPASLLVDCGPNLGDVRCAARLVEGKDAE